MATIRREFIVQTPPDAVWDALRDFQAVHERVARGFVVASKPEGEGARLITFANGVSVREDLISADNGLRRLAYTASGGQLAHHNGVVEVKAEEGGARVVWTLDILPDAAEPTIAAMMDAGAEAMRRTLGT